MSAAGVAAPSSGEPRLSSGEPGAGPAAAAAPGAAPPPARLGALDALRGLVMVLMTTDHASMAFNGARVAADGAMFYKAGDPLPAAQFWLRWVSHLCAPTFVFLAGAALAVSVARRRAAGAAVDRHLLTRGALLIALDLTFISYFWVKGGFQLQVLYAIGASVALLAALRRLPGPALLALGLGLVAGAEAILGAVIGAAGTKTPLGGLFLHGGMFTLPVLGRPLVISYPLLPWFGVMVLGWCFGRGLAAASDPAASARRWLPRMAAGSLAVFVVVRGLNGYGNMRLYRYGSSLTQWFHCSKYPPSLSFLSLELGLAFAILAGLFWVAGRRGAGTAGAGIAGAAPAGGSGCADAARPPDVIDRLVDGLARLGQTALFFYLAHIAVIEGAALALGVRKQLGMAEALGVSALALGVLYPLCGRYREFKRARPGSVWRYL